MGLFSKNGAIFLVCSAIGFLIGRYLFSGAWTTYASLLISYHLFLAWLVVTAEHEKGLSLPIFSTILTHLACLVLIISLAVVREYIPLFGVIRFFIPALAPFECTWLFSANPHKKKEAPVDPSVTAAANKVAAARAIATATGEDNEAWIYYLSHRNPKLRKPGMTIKEEYELWMVERVKSRTKAS